MDGIKIVHEGGFGDQTLLRLDRDVMAATTDEAQQHDLWIAAHTSSTEEERHVLEAGPVHTIEHGANADPLSTSVIDQMATRAVTYVPTSSVIENYAEQSVVAEEVFEMATYNLHQLPKLIVHVSGHSANRRFLPPNPVHSGPGTPVCLIRHLSRKRGGS